MSPLFSENSLTSVEVSISRVNNKFPSPNEYSNILRPKIFDTLSTNLYLKQQKQLQKITL